MASQATFLIDEAETKIGALDVDRAGELYSGTIDLKSAPPPIRTLFEKFEEMVEGQMFNLADEIEARIAGLHLKALFPSGKVAEIDDLQVFPSTGRVSFKVSGKTPVAP
ncbi:MAG: hypothetical protein U0793_05760 [Gemmataceae bacterium]